MYILCIYIIIYIYIVLYSHPGVDRISDMFNPDSKKNEIFSKPSVFIRFFVPVKVIFSQFWTRIWRNIEKTQTTKETKKIEYIKKKG